MSNLITKEFWKNNFEKVTMGFFLFSAALTSIFWVTKIHFKWVPITLIFVVNLYILLALYSAAQQGDNKEQKVIDDHSFLTNDYLPWRVKGLTIFICIFFTIVFGFASIYNDDFIGSRIDSLYFSLTTLTTVGYGDIHPDSWPSKIFVMYEMGSGILVFVGGLSFLISRISGF